MIRKLFIFAIVGISLLRPLPAADYPDLASRLMKQGMPASGAYRLLTELTRIGARPMGSKELDSAAQWGKKTMEQLGLENVRLEPVTVPHWVRGDVESVVVSSRGSQTSLSATALGGSVPTPDAGITAAVVELRSLDELKSLGQGVRGKIIFFNRPMDPSLFNTFEAYGGVHDQRTDGPAAAGALGAVAVLVRSLTLTVDDVPHTGATKYVEDSPRIPAAALSLVAANRLSDMLKQDPNLTVTVKLNPRMLPDAPSANVVGEIVGSEKPSEIVLIGAHLDSWDKGTGAHDDGAGCVHILEAASLIRSLGLKPKRTLRVVLFTNEEFGTRGGNAYAAEQRPAEEIHIAAIESDGGGFTPRGFSIKASEVATRKFQSFARWLAPAGAGIFIEGYGGSDIEPLAEKGIPVIGFMPDSQRYFDYHHSVKDTLDAVNPRELELGAVSIAGLAYILSEEGL